MKFKYQEIQYKIGARLFSCKGNEHLDDDNIGATYVKKSKNFDFVESLVVSPKKEITLNRAMLCFELNYKEVKRIFGNGFQSWSESREYNLEEKILQPLQPFKKLMANYGDYDIIQQIAPDAQLYSWNYTYLKLPKRELLWMGSLDESIGYTLFQFDLRNEELIVIKDCQGHVLSNEINLVEIFTSKTNEWNAANAYFRTMKLPLPKVKPAIGWTSWYNYYTKITEEIIEENISAFKNNNIQIDIIQIDDGYQKAVGDWMETNSKFPNGLKSLVEKIKKYGAKAGLWLAPMIVEKDSSIVKEHPDWLIKNNKGLPRKIGYNDAWSGWFYALNIYNIEVRDYLKKVFDFVLHTLGFDLVKLDFLFGAATQPLNGRSRGGVMIDTMNFLKTCIGDKIILGCGLPLAASIGKVDYCRIGPDVHLSWDFKALKWIRNKERPSNFNAINNSIYRRHLNGKAYLNDTDVFILRNENNKLSFEEKYTLLLSNLLFGDLIFTSDDISKYDEKILLLYKSLFPLRKISQVKVEQNKNLFKIQFIIKDLAYLALINNSSKKRQFKLPEGYYFNCLTKQLIIGGEYIDIKKHQSFCLLKIEDMPFAIMGSKGHFFSGSEVLNTYLNGNDLNVELEHNANYASTVYYKIPKHYKDITINGKKTEKVDKGTYLVCKIG